MSKQATLATCIAKLYEGGRLENSGTPSGTVKKPSPTLIGSLSNVEVKLNALEGKVEQIEHTQTEVLHKLSSLCQGMEVLERSLMQHKQGAQEANVIKNGQRESNKLPLLTEVRSLCGETVDLLHNLKHENQQQRKKIECMEISLSTLEKVSGYVGNAFRNSKIVEFILNGVVPWRKQGLLDTVEEEKNKPDDNSIKPNNSFCHQSTQTSEEVTEVISAETELLQPEVTVPTGPSSLPFPEALTGESEPLIPVSTGVSSKALRKAKEVTVKSRAPAQIQTFAPEIQLEEENDVHYVPKQETDISAAAQANAECVTVTTTKVEKDVALQQERGRFGQVHKCAELSSGLTLAAKILKVRGMKERDEVKNEIGVMNQLNHANLIQLYDAFESRTNLTLIMEYVEGGELFERIIDENYHLTELDAIVFTRQICEGVQYLHQQYILHLDLKPENILCVNSTGNQIKIIDFGLARKYRPREKLKVNFGTPEFLAPEVVNYDFVSFPTDMWSVGVITYMLLSGLSPFMGDNDTETMNNILHANWDFDAEAFENVSEEAKDFISSLLVPAKCSRMSASGCMKHSWLNNLEDKAKMYKVRLKSQMRLQHYLAAHRQWKKHFYAVAAANRLKRFQQNRSVSTPY
ncbi:myosin light chain kinase 3-like isoform X5 [Sinocyclocheilus anshuiensis]|uniref:myosin light chain kinase 3-like isoform X5 n=1 Tax=Sinocyclocheilus anshuiensis TaxID=1608454 RepID=UPI0007BA1D0A|nr:PREDICTED: myosin light chain kinase 3-like isoform X5 [Sinocyclocheilus anshuiensis]